MACYDYIVKRSRRRTVSVEITEDKKVLVRSPKWLPNYEIERFVEKNSGWIKKHLEKLEKREESQKNIAPLGTREIKELSERAAAVIPAKVRFFASLLGVSYGNIRIGNQKTIWGSCSAKGNLSFNCLLMRAPERVCDYVVVHELCHRLHMDHSKEFWECVGRIIPDSRQCRKWLRSEGALLMNAAMHGRKEEASAKEEEMRKLSEEELGLAGGGMHGDEGPERVLRNCIKCGPGMEFYKRGDGKYVCSGCGWVFTKPVTEKGL